MITERFEKIVKKMLHSEYMTNNMDDNVVIDFPMRDLNRSKLLLINTLKHFDLDKRYSKKQLKQKILQVKTPMDLISLVSKEPLCRIGKKLLENVEKLREELTQ
jgi:hypothetical protein